MKGKRKKYDLAYTRTAVQLEQKMKVKKSMEALREETEKGQDASEQSITGLEARVNLLAKRIEEINAEVLNRAYPVGSIYLSYGQNSPEAFLGGRWERVGVGLLRSCLPDETIGDGGTVNSGESGAAYTYINISAWRRVPGEEVTQ